MAGPLALLAPLLRIGSLFSGAANVAKAAGSGVRAVVAPQGKRLGRLIRGAASGNKAKGRLLGDKLWKGFGGATAKEVAQASPGWERAALRDQNLRALDRLVGTLGEYANGFAHSISVAVQGGPGADLRRCYYLACAAAFGRFRNGVSVVLRHEFTAHWDITAKVVQVTVSYTCGGTTGFINSLAGAVATTPLDVIQRGPDQVTIGASWPRFLKSLTGPVNQAQVANTVFQGGVPVLGANAVGVVGKAIQDGEMFNGLEQWTVDQSVLRGMPAVPISVLAPWAVANTPNVLRELPTGGNSTGLTYLMRVIAPVGRSNAQTFTIGALRGTVALPDTDRVITTGETDSPQVQPPRPPVDGISRGSLIGITIAALANPGVLAELPPLTDVPVASTGVYVPNVADAQPGAVGLWQAVIDVVRGAFGLPGTRPNITVAPLLKE